MDEQTRAEQKQQILVVDDSEDMRVLLGWVLEKAGYRVIFAGDGHASIIQAKLYHPDLILMDLSLPDINGWEAVAHLRKMPEFRTTPIVAVTAHVSPVETEQAMAIGCTAHMGKPFDTRALLQELARLLTSH
jgi:two-component system cell cycle response regulator DivK